VLFDMDALKRRAQQRAQQRFLQEAREILGLLRISGMEVGVVGAKIRVKNASKLTDQNRDKIRFYKQALITLLRIEQLESSAKQDKWL
jgi:hypothetical protein